MRIVQIYPDLIPDFLFARFFFSRYGYSYCHINGFLYVIKKYFPEFVCQAILIYGVIWWEGARCSSMVRAFTHGAMGSQIYSSWGGPIELFLVPASAPRLV